MKTLEQSFYFTSYMFMILFWFDFLLLFFLVIASVTKTFQIKQRVLNCFPHMFVNIPSCFMIWVARLLDSFIGQSPLEHDHSSLATYIPGGIWWIILHACCSELYITASSCVYLFVDINHSDFDPLKKKKLLFFDLSNYLEWYYKPPGVVMLNKIWTGVQYYLSGYLWTFHTISRTQLQVWTTLTCYCVIWFF